MENLIWLVVLGALFYFMMRKGGCGEGHSHGKHESKHQSDSNNPADNQMKNSEKKHSGCH